MLLAIIISLLIIISSFAINGCYLIHLAVGQLSLIKKIKPFDIVLNDPEFSAEIKHKIKLVKHVKSFAINNLALTPPEDTYSHFLDLKGHTPIFSLSAAYPYKLEPLFWHFPLFGKVPYLSFFNKQKALIKQDALKKRNFDTILRGVSAYSTAGFLPEPLFSSMLRYDPNTLINVLIHEMAHNTVLFKNNFRFNESFANFIANAGTTRFINMYKHLYPSLSKTRFNNSLEDTQLLHDFMLRLIDKLNEAFNNNKLSTKQKIRQKYIITSQFKNIFRKQVIPKFKVKRFSDNLIKPNNAFIMSYIRYNSSKSLFEKLLKHFNYNLKHTSLFIRNIPRNQNPFSYIKLWLLKQNMAK